MCASGAVRGTSKRVSRGTYHATGKRNGETTFPVKHDVLRGGFKRRVGEDKGGNIMYSREEVCDKCIRMPYAVLWHSKQNMHDGGVQKMLIDLADPDCVKCRGTGKIRVRD